LILTAVVLSMDKFTSVEVLEVDVVVRSFDQSFLLVSEGRQAISYSSFHGRRPVSEVDRVEVHSYLPFNVPVSSGNIKSRIG
jgi:hypothetical protein